MKTSGFRCETKFGLLGFLGHPTVHLSTTMYHYAACFYTEGNLAFMIDPGRNNIRQDDGTQDEFGQRFKYK